MESEYEEEDPLCSGRPHLELSFTIDLPHLKTISAAISAAVSSDLGGSGQSVAKRGSATSAPRAFGGFGVSSPRSIEVR